MKRNRAYAYRTENYFCINSQASEADQKASLDFIKWLFSSEEGKDIVTNKLGFITPFNTFTGRPEADRPAGKRSNQIHG
ncbi:MAG: hypothetical protein V8R80_12235 [Eubacterium sp.]